MIRGHTVLLALSFCYSLHAERLDKEYLRALTLARTATDVEQLHLAYRELRVAQTACQIQLEEQSLPSSCYEADIIAAKWRPHDSAPLKLARLRKLDRLCAIAAEKLRIPDVSPSMLSESCAKSVRQARAIQVYREQEDVGPDIEQY